MSDKQELQGDEAPEVDDNADDSQSEPAILAETLDSGQSSQQDPLLSQMLDSTFSEPAPSRMETIKREIIDWSLAIAIAVVCLLLVRTFVFTVVKVDGTSMLPTLENSDKLIVWRLGYKPHRGDICIFRPDNGSKSPYIKRIIATAGQVVTIDNATNKVTVDGLLLSEPYINNPTTSTTGEFVVPEGHVFVMGDNRQVSRDSRSADVGFVDENSLMGRAVIRIFPISKFGLFR